jgi:uncharacterized membrane protein YoaK (UPF0700 family)
VTARVAGFRARHRTLLLAALTMVSGCTDAISYLGLGHVFPANMTGNTVLLGIGLATADPGAATRSATALGAFLVGAAAVGAALPQRVGRGALHAVLGVEAVLLTALCGGWLAAGAGHPAGAVRYALIGLAGATMGVQSAVVRTLGVPVATTYITGTWTALSAGVGARLRRRPDDRDDRSLAVQAVVVVTYLGTACGAALAYTRIAGAATLLPLGLVLLVHVVAGARRPDAAGLNSRD